jgi:hypothetical protein
VIEEFCDWLSRTSVSVAFQSATWFVPTVQTVHIIAIAILLVTIYVIGFKLAGIIRGGLPLAAVMRKASPWVWSMLIVLLLTGALLTITEPSRELLNWVFRTKMVLVVCLSLLVVWLNSRVRVDPNYWSATTGRKMAARIWGVLVLVIGAGIITAGRWIAYV